MIKISIITINFNNAAGLKRTLESIKNLKCPDGIELESIVVDGASRDDSVNVIKSFSDTVTRYISEPDGGIYDAMNKGIKMANGQWLNFMNSGDIFVDNMVLDSIYKENHFQNSRTTLIIGDNLRLGITMRAHPLHFAEKGIIPACHQSMIFKNIGYFYNIKYKIYSDYDFFLNYYISHSTGIVISSLLISESEPDGVGSRVSYTKRKDKILIILKRFGLQRVMAIYLRKLISL